MKPLTVGSRRPSSNADRLAQATKVAAERTASYHGVRVLDLGARLNTAIASAKASRDGFDKISPRPVGR
jgi:hypothetical protein